MIHNGSTETLDICTQRQFRYDTKNGILIIPRGLIPLKAQTNEMYM